MIHGDIRSAHKCDVRIDRFVYYIAIFQGGGKTLTMEPWFPLMVGDILDRRLDIGYSRLVCGGEISIYHLLGLHFCINWGHILKLENIFLINSIGFILGRSKYSLGMKPCQNLHASLTINVDELAEFHLRFT